MKTRAAIAREVAGGYDVDELIVAPPQPGEIMVRMVAIAVSLSDQVMGMGECPDGLPPALVRQAGAGIVSAVGPDTPDWAIGDHVIMGAVRRCDGNLLATHATLSVLSVLKVPASLPLERACMSGLGADAGWSAGAHSFEVEPGHTVIVIGAGGVGKLAVRQALGAGARHVIVVDRLGAGHAAALAAGATHVCAGIDEAGALARALTHGRGANAAAITLATLDTTSLRQALDCVAENGTVVCTCLGENADADLEVSVFAVTLQRKRVQGVMIGAVCPRWEFLRGLQMHAGDGLQLDQFTFTRFTPGRIDEACTDLRAGPHRRAVILFE